MAVVHHPANQSTQMLAAAAFSRPTAQAIGAAPVEYNGPAAFEHKVREGQHTWAFIKIPPDDSLARVIVPIEQLDMNQLAENIRAPIIYLTKPGDSNRQSDLTHNIGSGAATVGPNAGFDGIVKLFENVMSGDGKHDYYTSNGIITLERTKDELTIFRRWGITESMLRPEDLGRLPDNATDLTAARLYNLSLKDYGLSISSGIAYVLDGRVQVIPGVQIDTPDIARDLKALYNETNL